MADEKLVFAFRPAHIAASKPSLSVPPPPTPPGQRTVRPGRTPRPALHGRAAVTWYLPPAELAAAVAGRRGEYHGSQLFGVEPVGKPLLPSSDGAQSRRPFVGRMVVVAVGSTFLTMRERQQVNHLLSHSIYI